MKLLTAEGLARILTKTKEVYATKTEVASKMQDLQSPSGTIGQSVVHTEGNETIAGTKTFSSTIDGSINGNAATATKATQDANGNVINSTYVNLTDTQTISGTKTVTAVPTILMAQPGMVLSNSNLTKTTNPSTIQYGNIFFQDKTTAFNTAKRGGSLDFSVSTNGQTEASLRAFDWGQQNNTNGAISIYYPKGGTPYTAAPTPAVDDNSTKIATTAWTRTATGNFACNAATATKATGDSNGRNISTGYMWRGSYERIEGTSDVHKDLNNYQTAGFYNVKTVNTDNCPSGIGIDAVLLVYPWDRANYLTQEITESAASGDCRRWIRKLNSSTWSAWKQVAFTESSITGNAATVTGTAGTSTLAWNSEVTLYTVGGNAIKAKLPANPNTDVKVRQDVGTTSTERPILSRYNINDATQTANYVVYDTGVTNNPNTHTLTASGGFNGNLTGNVTGNCSGSSGSCTGNAKTATTLATARDINISDADGTNTGTKISFNGSANGTIKLPSTIKASITGNCSGSSGSCTGNAKTATTLATARDINISDADGTNTGTKISFNGSANGTIKLPATIKASITGNCSGSSGSCTGLAAKATADANGANIASTYAKLASPALTGTPTSTTAALGTNSTQIATTAFVYQNAARILNADTTIYVAQAKAGTGDGSSAANAMTTDDMWKYLASVRMVPAAGVRENSRTLTIKFVPNGTTSYGNVTFDGNKMPGVRNLVIDMSGTTASTTSNYTTNCPTFGNLYVLGGNLHVTLKNINCVGLIQAEWHARVIINTFIGAQRFVAVNYGRMEIGNGVYAIKNAGTDYLAKGTEYGQMIMVTKTCNFHFMEQVYYTGGIYLSDTNGRMYVRHDYIKLTGTQPIVTLTASGTKTGTCSTAAGTAAKAVTLESGQTFTLANNAVAYVTFSNTNTAANPTLNINGTGAKPIYFNSAAIPAAYINKHIQYKFTYNGTQYVCNNGFNRVEVASTHSMFSRNGAIGTTYNSGSWNWTGYSTSFSNGANVAGTVYGNASSASKVNTNLVLKIKTGTTENTSLYTYNGSAAKTLDIKQGTNVTLTAAANALTIAATTSSDARMKTKPIAISDDILDSWGQLAWTQFKYLKEIEENGDNAKYHFGLIAQDVNAKMDPSLYAFTESVPNDDEATMEEMPEYWTMNYIEALVMEAAWQRRENDQLRKKLLAAENKLSVLEKRIETIETEIE